MLKLHNEWYSAVEKDFSCHAENNTWTLAPMHLSRDVIGCVCVFKVKRDSNGEIVKFETRVCTQGDQRTHEYHYNETFAPTRLYMTLILLSLACSFDRCQFMASFKQDFSSRFKIDDLGFLVHQRGFWIVASVVIDLVALVCWFKHIILEIY
jgi:hypothetical protein